MKKVKKTLGILAGVGAALYAGLFAVFYFDLDGKLLFYVVEPLLKQHDLMDPRTVSRRDMRAKVTNYMRAIIQAEPTDESLIEFEDDITW